MSNSVPSTPCCDLSLFRAAPPHLLDLSLPSSPNGGDLPAQGASVKERWALCLLWLTGLSGGQVEERPSQWPAMLDVHHSDTDLLSWHLLSVVKETAAWHLKGERKADISQAWSKWANNEIEKASYWGALMVRWISQAVSSFAYRLSSERTHGHHS